MQIKRFSILISLLVAGLLLTLFTVTTLQSAAPAAPPRDAETTGQPLPPPDWSDVSAQTAAEAGSAVHVADVDGDESEDLIVGSPGSNQVDIYLNTGSTGLPLSPTLTLNRPGGAFGYALATGLFNNDFLPDLAVGAPTAGTGGRVFIYPGTITGLLTTPDIILNGSVDSHFGHSLATHPDISGDGSNALVVGSPAVSPALGHVDLFTTANGVLVTVPAWTVTNPQPDSAFGHAVAVGDVNADGIDDVSVGAPEYANSFAREGSLDVYYGSAASTPSLSPDSTLYGGQSDAHFGFALFAGENVDQDINGHTDLIVGAPGYTNAFDEPVGAAFVYLGQVGGPLPADGRSPLPVNSLPILGKKPDGRFGSAVAAGGFTFSSNTAVIVGANAYGSQVGEANEGSVFFYFYDFNTQLPSTTPGWRLESNIPNAAFGSALALGNLDPLPDSSLDLAVGAPGLGNARGGAFVYYGTAGGFIEGGITTLSNTSPTRLGNTTFFTAAVGQGGYLLYDWDFGDGSAIESTFAMSQSPPSTVQHIYAEPGTYIAKVSVVYPGIAQPFSATTQVVVQEPIAAVLAVSDAPTEVGQTTTFSVTAVSGTDIDYRINYGDGSPEDRAFQFSPDAPVVFSHTYASIGEYDVVVTAENAVSFVTDTLKARVFRPIPLTPEDGGSFSHDFPNGNTFGFNAPPGSVGGLATLKFNPLDDPGFPNPPGALGLYFELELENAPDVDLADHCLYLPLVTSGSGSFPGGILPSLPPNCPFELQLLRSVTVTLQYNEASLPPNASEEEIRLYFYNEETGAWEDGATTCSPESEYVRDLANNTITLQICHLSRWAY